MKFSRASEPLALDQLGWRQFVDLCIELVRVELGVGPEAWVSEDDRAWYVIAPVESKAPAGSSEHLSHIEVVWVSDGLDSARSSSLEAQLFALKYRLRSESWSGPVAVISNYTGRFADRERVRTVMESDRVELLGPGWLSESIDASPQLRLAMPSLLSLAGLERWLPTEPRSSSTFDLAAARALAEVFVPTHAHRAALRVLGVHHFAVLTGPPEMGKTSIARMVALALMTDGWEAFECTTPEQLIRAFDGARRQVFIADDAFGSTEYRPDSGERWAREMERLLRMMDDEHWLIWTSRPAPLRAGLRRIHQERGAERFPQPAEVVVDASSLTLDEKVLILLRHAKATVSNKDRRALRQIGYQIVFHTHFTPERIRRLVAQGAGAFTRASGRELEEMIERQIQTPTEAMAASFAALSAEHQSLLFALLDAPPGPIEERELARLARLHTLEGLSRSPMELVDRLADHFLRVSETLRIDWVHPSWRDLVIERLQHDDAARRRFLQRCTLEGVLLAMAVGGGARGDRTLALLLSDQDWDLAADRVVLAIRELPDADVERLLDQLAAALTDVDATDKRQLDELRALAGTALLEAATRLDGGPTAADLDLIGAWLRLAWLLPERPTAARLDGTWAELLPGGATDLNVQADLDQVVGWLELGNLLCEYSPEQAAVYGFPERHLERMHGLLDQSQRLLAGEGFRGDRRQLMRLLRLCRIHGSASPQTRSRYDELIFEVGQQPEVEEQSEPFPLAELSRRQHVERILEDL